MTFEVGDKIRCLRSDGYAGLKVGDIYTVVRAAGRDGLLTTVEPIHWNGQEMIRSLAYASRFEKVEPEACTSQFKVGDLITCIRGDGLSLRDGRVYTVQAHGDVLDGKGTILLKETEGRTWFESRFELFLPPKAKVLEPKAQAPLPPAYETTPYSDMDHMKRIMTRAGVIYSSWHIGEYVAKSGDTVAKFDGWVLVHGSNDEGPYTEYVFDSDGMLIQAQSCYEKKSFFVAA